ncbi:MAG: alpha,2-mannosyltransferase [Micromonosporaceae bacterium]|nr:alpha,2-mannosyltransferase [Micromonosporaceae bacterium]
MAEAMAQTTPDVKGPMTTTDSGALTSGSGPSESPSDRRILRRQVLVVSGLAIAVAVFLITYAERHGFFDLRVYHGAINYWVHDGGSLYDFVLPFSTYGFTYPPFAALVMLPMAITPWTLAIVITCIACAVVSAVLVYWLIDPVARREGWTRWYAFAIAMCFAAAFEPLRETFLFGQVNMFLVFMVAADLLLFTSKGSRFGGIGIGLATAIKLTPGIFIVYLLVTKRWRAAIVASGTAAVASIVAAALAPDDSRVFWTDALWNTDRIGAVAFISNQSLNGAVARMHAANPSTALWLVSAAAVMVWWVVRVRRTAAAGDEMTGFALTGIVGCLVSPITWIHHLVWVGPALLLLLDNALVATSPRRRKQLLALMIFSYVVLCSRFVWNYHDSWGNPVSWFFSNSYVWVSLALFLVLPIRQVRGARRRLSIEPGMPAGHETSAESVSADPVAAVAAADAEGKTEPDPRRLNGHFAGTLEGVRAPDAVISEAVPLVEGSRPSVALEHP